MTRVASPHLLWAQSATSRPRHILADSAIATPDLRALGLPHAATIPADSYEAIERLERGLGARLGAPGGRVIVTAGASEANAAVFAALLSPGDEVLVEVPGYEPHHRVPEAFGARVRGFPRSGVPGALASEVEGALGKATRLVVISDLQNPRGVPLDAGEAEALAALAKARGFRVLCDETFRDADRRPLGNWVSRHPEWVSTASLTKAYGLGGMRIGWITAAPALLAACKDGHNTLSAMPSTLSVALALELLPSLDTLRERTHAILAMNHARWAALVRAHPRFGGTASRGTTTWCEFSAEREGDAFAAHAAERFDLAIARGSFFGRPQGVRIALGGKPGSFAAAVAVLEQAAAAFPWAVVREMA